jgi:hypothetical protein
MRVYLARKENRDIMAGVSIDGGLDIHILISKGETHSSTVGERFPINRRVGSAGKLEREELATEVEAEA